MFRHGICIAACLVHHQDAGLSAGFHVDRVVACAGAGYHLQPGAARDQLRRDLPLQGNLILGGRHVVDVGLRQHGPVGVFVAMHVHHRELDAGFLADDLVEAGVDPHVQSQYVDAHFMISQPRSARVRSIQLVDRKSFAMSSIIWTSASFFATVASYTASTSLSGTHRQPSASPRIRSPGWITMPPKLTGTLISPGPSL